MATIFEGYEVRPALWVDGQRAEAPVPVAAQSALDEWMKAHKDEMAEVLAPFGLNPYDLCPIEYRRVIPAS